MTKLLTEAELAAMTRRGELFGDDCDTNRLLDHIAELSAKLAEAERENAELRNTLRVAGEGIHAALACCRQSRAEQEVAEAAQSAISAALRKGG